jgi:hypothetical protein
LLNIRGYGYVVADPSGHLKQGRAHRKRGDRQFRRAHSTVTNVDLNGADPKVRDELVITRRVLEDQLEANRRFDQKLRRRADRRRILLGEGDT